MTYQNPVIPGFFPDPSVVRVEDTYYLVCSSIHLFPGIPLFKSKDLINWEFFGNVLTRESQLNLKGASIWSGIFAPTIRYNKGRFYVVTTNVTNGGNFYVYTDDICGEWSEPIFVEQDGIDPSFYFEGEKAYFMSNGTDDEGIGGIVQCELDMETGKKLTPSKCIWHGTGGRFLESPHLYKIGNYYYLLAAEGGTEYGHMIVYARGTSIYGPFENYSKNPVLTNRNLGGHQIQAIGHGDLVEDTKGNYWMIHLGFRQIGDWVQHHITGRDVYLVPVVFDEEGWFSAGEDGTTRALVETDLIDVKQEFWREYTFENTKVGREWCFLLNPELNNYEFTDKSFKLNGTEVTLSDGSRSPTFIGMRQRELNLTVSVKVDSDAEEAGISLHMSPEQHYEIAVKKEEGAYKLIRRLSIGNLQCEDKCINITSGSAELIVEAKNFDYWFNVISDGQEYDFGTAQTKYLSSEITGNFSGVMIGLYAIKGKALFTEFSCRNDEKY